MLRQFAIGIVLGSLFVNGVLAAPPKSAAGSTLAKMSSGPWGQWRGPNRDGISPEKGLLQEWPEKGPPLAWQTKGLGGGFSSVAVVGDRIYTMGNSEGNVNLQCRSTKDGSQIWSTPIGGGSDPNCTPTVDGDLVFGVTHAGDLACCKTVDGTLVWKKNFGKDFGGKMMSGWGYSESPLVDGDWLLCTPGAEKAMLAALNKRTGEVIWKSAMPEKSKIGNKGQDGAGYASIVISHAAGVKQYVTLVGRGIVSVEAKTGEFLWLYNRVANGTACIPTPIVKDDFIFCSSGYGDGGTALLKISKANAGWNAEEVYYFEANKLQNHHGGMILLGNYVFLGHGHNNGFPVCVHLGTGEKAWSVGRGPGEGSAAIAYADGRLYFRYQNGVMALMEANPEKYVLKGSFKLASVQKESWPHPAIANGKLYLRDWDSLMCYDIKAK